MREARCLVDVQRLLELRKALQERVAQLQRELELYSAMLSVLDKAIGEGSFSTAAQAAAAREGPEAVEEVRGRGGEVYATVEVYGDRLHIKFARPVRLDGLFKRFFLDKFLQKYRSEDAEAVRQGSLRQEEVLRYELEEGEGGVVGMRLYNYRTEERKREILRVLRWTLEKVYSA
jgi:hypothetical protein